MEQLILTALPGIPLIKQGDDLAEIALQGLRRSAIVLQDGDILVFAQKVVSKAEGRLVFLRDVTPTPAAIELSRSCGFDARYCEVLLWDTLEVLHSSEGSIIVETKHGWVCSSAGLDTTNIASRTGREWEVVLRLPEDADRSADDLRRRLRCLMAANVGVVVDDTHEGPWRTGAVGVAIGVAGLPAVEDLSGRVDLFRHPFSHGAVGTADQLAAAASLLQGQADEGKPIVHVRGFPMRRRDGSSREITHDRVRLFFPHRVVSVLPDPT